MEKASFLARVRGRVQGVGYRYFAYREAAAFNISGYVKNLMDGQVEVYAEGPRDQLEQFLNRLKAGPHFGHVDGVEVEWEEYRDRYDKFFIDSGYGY